MPSSILNSDNGVVSGSTGIKTTGGDDGVLLIQTNGVTAATVNSSQVVTFANAPVGIPAPASLSTASGSAPSYSARAWVNFNGTGTVAIRASGNVSSITDNGTGTYTVNFTTAMNDENYAITVVAKRGSFNESLFGSSSTTTPTTGSCRIIVGQASFNLFDGDFVSFAAFR